MDIIVRILEVLDDFISNGVYWGRIDTLFGVLVLLVLIIIVFVINVM